MAVESWHFVEAYRARSLLQAHMFCDALDDAGIVAHVENNEIIQFLYLGVLTTMWCVAPRIMVADVNLAEAREIIEEMELEETQAHPPADVEHESDAMRCLSCGQVMGEGETVCPSCGWTYEDEEAC